MRGNFCLTLAKFTAGPIPVISVYLNTQWRDPQQRARVTTCFERHLHQARALEPETAAARQSLARALERLTQWGQHHLQSTGESTMPGVALFACSVRCVAVLWLPGNWGKRWYRPSSRRMALSK